MKEALEKALTERKIKYEPDLSDGTIDDLFEKTEKEVTLNSSDEKIRDFEVRHMKYFIRHASIYMEKESVNKLYNLFTEFLECRSNFHIKHMENMKKR